MKNFLLISLLLVAEAAWCQPPGTEIYLFDLSVKKNKVTLSSPRNITNRSGYDNQPFFHPDKPLVYYSSADESGRTDILVYNYKTGETSKLTHTPEREYSPTVTPDKKFISCIIQRGNGAQDLGKYSVDGGEPEIIINNLTVGYHAWADDDRVFVFVLGQPNSLQSYSVKEKKDVLIADNIGRSLHRIPGTTDISFVDKSGTEWLVKKVNGKDGTIETLAPTLSNREDLAWTPDGKIIMSDGEKIFYWQGKSKEWLPVQMQGNLTKGITRIAVSAKGDKMAIVINE